MDRSHAADKSIRDYADAKRASAGKPMRLSRFDDSSLSLQLLSGDDHDAGMGQRKDLKGGITFSISELCSVFRMADLISRKA